MGHKGGSNLFAEAIVGPEPPAVELTSPVPKGEGPGGHTQLDLGLKNLPGPWPPAAHGRGGGGGGGGGGMR
jgi:hypothetical protein